MVQLQKVLADVGINSGNFAGHSFFIGTAATVAAKGAEDSTIKILGRRESAAYQRYVKIHRHSLDAVSKTLGQLPHSNVTRASHTVS